MAILQSIRQLEAVRDGWNVLADTAGHPMLRHEWVLSAAAMLADPNRLAVMVQTTGDRVDAVAPLEDRIVGGVARLQLIGADTLHEPSGLLYRDGASLARLVEELFTLGKPVVLQRIVTEAGPLVAAARSRGLLVPRHTAPWLGIELADRGTDLLRDLPGKLRYDIKRARTRASDLGECATEILTPSPDEAAVVIDRFVEVEATGWKRHTGTALAVNHRLQRFFRMYARLAAAAGVLRVFFLRIGRKIAAAQIATEMYERLWILKIGYDESMQRCSPGFLLTSEAIAYAATRGLRSYEFLGAPENWEERWRPEPRRTELLVFYPWTVKGCFGASLDVANAAWRRLRRAAHAN